MVFVGAVGVPTFMTTYYYYELLTQIGLLLVIPIAFFLAGQVALILWLLNHRNPVLRTAGEAFGAVTQYLGLFEGLILTVLVFYLLGGAESTSGPGGFTADFIIGTTYLSMFIYGAVGLPLAFWSERLVGKLAAAVYAFIALVPPFWLVFFEEKTIRAHAATDAGGLLLAALAFYMAMSVIGMWLFIGPLTGGSKKAKVEKT